jgi:hypothetical protein
MRLTNNPVINQRLRALSTAYYCARKPRPLDDTLQPIGPAWRGPLTPGEMLRMAKHIYAEGAPSGAVLPDLRGEAEAGDEE